jgi:ABC-type amino acid transport system permease subunit
LAAAIAAVILASLLGLVALVGANAMMDKSAIIALQAYNDGIVTTVSATPHVIVHCMLSTVN